MIGFLEIYATGELLRHQITTLFARRTIIGWRSMQHMYRPPFPRNGIVGTFDCSDGPATA
jgi:hypothetical protein